MLYIFIFFFIRGNTSSFTFNKNSLYLEAPQVHVDLFNGFKIKWRGGGGNKIIRSLTDVFNWSFRIVVMIDYTLLKINVVFFNSFWFLNLYRLTYKSCLVNFVLNSMPGKRGLDDVHKCFRARLNPSTTENLICNQNTNGQQKDARA